jgi:hypothetical protein
VYMLSVGLSGCVVRQMCVCILDSERNSRNLARLLCIVRPQGFQICPDFLHLDKDP